MPIPELVKFREKYPQYNDLDDKTIADKLATKYPDAYGDLASKVSEANKKIGVFGQVTQDEYSQGKRNWLGNIVDRPSAAVRGAIQAEPSLALSGPFAGLLASSGIVGNRARTAALDAAKNPLSVKTFQEKALENIRPIKSTNEGVNFLTGIIPSTAGLAADLATDPVNVLGSLVGFAPLGKSRTLGGTLGKTVVAKEARKIGNTDVKELPRVLSQSIDTLRGVNPESSIQIIDKSINRIVENGISKGVRPTVVGKKTPKRQEKFYQDATDGIKAIVATKDELFTDETGNAISKLPENLGEYSHAVDTLKQKIYSEYTRLAQEAGDNGASFNVKPIIEKLKTIADEGNKRFTPSERKYAQDLMFDIAELEGADPLVVQERIKKLNQNLAPYFQGKTERMQASIDASVAALMREELDKKITGAAGGQYSELKKLYGSLKAVENDVNHRAIVYARKAPKTVFDLVDVFSTGQALRGALTSNPTEILVALAQSGVKEAFKAINNPNRIIKNMFLKTDRLMSKRNDYLGRIDPTFVGELVDSGRESTLRPRITPQLTGEAQKQIPFFTRGLPAPNTTYGEGFTANPAKSTLQKLRSQLALPKPKTKYGEGFMVRPKSFQDVLNYNRMLGKKKLSEKYKGGKSDAEILLRQLWEGR
jgi:hypothetical protein